MKDTGCEGQTETFPQEALCGHLATTQTPWPRAKKDQKVLGRPADLKLWGSLATLISYLMYCLHHLLPPVTDKPSRCRWYGLPEKLRHHGKCPVDLAESNPHSTCDVQCAQAHEGTEGKPEAHLHRSWV